MISGQRRSRSARSVFFWSLVIQALFLGCAHSSAVKATDVAGALEPTEELSDTAQDVVKEISQTHYVTQELDDRLSDRAFERYLSDLDATRSTLSARDIASFERYRFKLDDALRTGEIEPVFSMYNRFQQRSIEQLQFLIEMIEKHLAGISFDADESVMIDRKNAPWPADDAALRDLWRRRLKSQLLNLKLAGKPADKAAELLLKRYRNQLNQVRQLKPEDVATLFLNSYAHCYDPHTEYLPPRASENFNISMSLSLEGIGAVLQNENEYTKVVSLVKGGPADKSGLLKPADRIVGVGQGPDSEIVNVVGWRIDDVVQLIRGPRQTVVRLEIIPALAADEHQSRTISIVRDTVKLEEQAAKTKIITVRQGGAAKKIGVIDLPTFYHDFRGDQSHTGALRSTVTDVKRLLGELAREKVSAIVLDLRDNGGGALNESIAVTGLFIDRGPVVQVRDSRGKNTVLSDPEPGIAYRGPLVVLVGRTSASASEICAAAIQDYRRGVIMGEQTFGKGTVQALLPLKKGQLKVTQAKFYRVSGESTQSKGVSPDITCPSLYDKSKIGESALPDALPWDKIRAAAYTAGPDLRDVIPRLERQHAQRSAANADYVYLQELADHIRELSEKNTVSLSETVRRAEDAAEKKWRLDHENKRRAANGLPRLDRLPDNDTDREHGSLLETDNRTDEPGIDKDPVLTEAAHVAAGLQALAPAIK